MKNKICLTAALLFILKTATFAQPGTLDNTFGTGGKVTTPIGSSHDIGMATAIQSDGKIVAAGYSRITTYDFALVRYNSDGSLDTTFGAGGKVTTDFGSSEDYCLSLAIQSDGKIVAAGGKGCDFCYGDFALARYNSDGSLDNTFGTGGKVTTDFAGLDDSGYSIAIQSDGKIVVAGVSSNVSDNDFALARYNSDGSLDNTFGAGGKVITDFGSSDDYGYSLAIQSDGKIVVAGYSVNVSSDGDFALARYNSNGSLDNTFGAGGKVTADFGSSQDDGNSVVIQSDGKILVAGYSQVSTYDFALMRCNSDGTLDNTFGAAGKVTTDFGSSTDYGYSAAIRSDGKIVVAGVSSIGSNSDFALVRYNSDGSLDNSFGSAGKITTDFAGLVDYGYSTTIQSDGKIVVAGGTYNGANYDFALVRYNGGLLGVAENTEDADVSIYPNPTVSELNIQNNSTQPIQFSLYNSLGEKIIEKFLTVKLNTIDLSSFTNGIYFYKVVERSSKITTGKIIKL